MSKTIGIMGTVSPNIINFYFTEMQRLILETYGEGHNINILIKSIDVATLNRLRAESKWDELREVTIQVAESLQNAGADVIISTNNSLLFGIDEYIKSRIDVPVVKVTVEIVKQMLLKKYKKVLLFGNKYSMDFSLYKDLAEDFGIQFLLPNDDDKAFVHNNIYNELAYGVITPEAREQYLKIINKFVKEEKIDVVVFTSVELSYLLNQDHLSTPLIVPYLVSLNKSLELIERIKLT